MPKEREEGEGEVDGDSERRKKVGHYVLGPCLGEGSFAKVRVGTHIISREKVAVKIVSKRVIIRRDAARRNFRREALLLQHVFHPNVVRLFEAMETPNSYYLVFELASCGHLLGYVTARKCLGEGEARRFMRQIVSAVDHLHRSSIVHRDLKLENCLLNSNLDIKIIDFGLSALCQRDSGLHTQCGSPAYAAPEIFGNRRYGPAVDLWSIGVCLYAMVVGRLPFLPHPPTNMHQLHAMILKGAVIPAFLSQGLQQLLSGLLEVQESRRMSVTDLLHQSWLTCNRSQPISRHPPVSKTPPPQVDTNIVRYMTNVFRFSESDVIHSVTERKLNASSATYHLLKRHMEGERVEKENSVGVREGGAKENGRGSEYGRSIPSEYGRSVASEYGRPVTSFSIKPLTRERASGMDNNNSCPAVSDDNTKPHARDKPTTSGESSRPAGGSNYTRSTASHGGGNDSEEETESWDDDNASGGGCLVLRSHIQPPTPTPTPIAHFQSGEKKRDSCQQPSNYKECILYLKEARHGLAFSGRSLAHLHRDLILDKATPRLPLLSLHRPRHHGNFHGNQTPGSLEAHQCSDKGRHHVQTSSDVKLNILGKAALKDRGDKGDLNPPLANSSHVSMTSQDGAKLPPPPPNTAQGERLSIRAQPGSSDGEGRSSPRPSTACSVGSEFSLRDPFSRDTWRMVLHHELRLAGENEAAYQKSRGTSFVAPLSTPKALTSREESSGSNRKQSYFLVRQLAADLNRKRGSGVHKKVSRSLTSHTADHMHVIDDHTDHHHHHHNNTITNNDDNDDDDNASRASSAEGIYGDSLDKERFLTPVIRVTITSTAKQ